MLRSLDIWLTAVPSHRIEAIGLVEGKHKEQLRVFVKLTSLLLGIYAFANIIFPSPKSASATLSSVQAMIKYKEIVVWSMLYSVTWVVIPN